MQDVAEKYHRDNKREFGETAEKLREFQKVT
jgi:hypothetical protein